MCPIVGGHKRPATQGGYSDHPRLMRAFLCALAMRNANLATVTGVIRHCFNAVALHPWTFIPLNSLTPRE